MDVPNNNAATPTKDIRLKIFMIKAPNRFYLLR
jgi:hypothetical protein